MGGRARGSLLAVWQRLVLDFLQERPSCSVDPKAKAAEGERCQEQDAWESRVLVRLPRQQRTQQSSHGQGGSREQRGRLPMLRVNARQLILSHSVGVHSASSEPRDVRTSSSRPSLTADLGFR